MEIKKILNVIKNVFCTIFATIGVIATSLFARKITENKEDTKKSEDIENEIKNTSASDIVSTSTNQDAISSTIEQQQQDLRQRIRDRLNKNV